LILFSSVRKKQWVRTIGRKRRIENNTDKRTENKENRLERDFQGACGRMAGGSVTRKTNMCELFRLALYLEMRDGYINSQAQQQNATPSEYLTYFRRDFNCSEVENVIKTPGLQVEPIANLPRGIKSTEGGDNVCLREAFPVLKFTKPATSKIDRAIDKRALINYFNI
jgi:hypothetical protein